MVLYTYCKQVRLKTTKYNLLTFKVQMNVPIKLCVIEFIVESLITYYDIIIQIFNKRGILLYKNCYV